MKRSALLIVVAIALTLAASGCGASKTSTPASHTSPTGTTTTQQTALAALEDAVRVALTENGRLSSYVLWNNTIPSWASRSTAGPALAALTASAAGRRRQNVRVRSLSEHLKILSIQLDPSYTSATAAITASGQVAVYTHGRRERTVPLNEHDRLILHRPGQAVRFVVWEVKAQK